MSDNNNNACRFCKGANPHCKECSTMGICPDAGYKSVSITDYSQLTQTTKTATIKPRSAGSMYSSQVASYYSYGHSFKKATKRALKVPKRKVKRLQQPTLGDKYGLLFQAIKYSINNQTNY